MSIPTLSRVILATPLLVASLAKAFNFAWFVKKVIGYTGFNGLGGKLLAGLVIAAEFGIGCWVATSVAKVASAGSAAVLLVLFTVVVAINLVVRKSRECGCFPFLPSLRSGWPLIARNVSLITLAWLSTSPVLPYLRARFVFVSAIAVIIVTLGVDIVVVPHRANKSLQRSAVSQ